MLQYSTGLTSPKDSILHRLAFQVFSIACSHFQTKSSFGYDPDGEISMQRYVIQQADNALTMPLLHI